MRECDKNENLLSPKNNSDRNNFIDSTKKKLEVILVYPAWLREERLPYSHAILRAWLKQIWIIPEVYSAYSDRDKIQTKMKEKWVFQVRWIGTYYETIPETLLLAKQIYESYPDERVVSIWWSGVNDLMTRDYIFSQWGENVNNINYGQWKPFLDWINKIKKIENFDINELKVLATQSWLCTKENIDVPAWEFPHLERFPLLWSTRTGHPSEDVSLEIPSYFNCYNGCDFCALCNFSSPHIVDDMIKSIKSFQHSIKEVVFSWPTFEAHLIKSFRKILTVIYEKQWFMPKTHMVMDSKQFQQNNMSKTLELLEEFNTHSVHIGLNTLDEWVAEMVGRKNNWKNRTQHELDDEAAWILKFAKNVDMTCIDVDMLLTPFDTPDTIKKLIDFYWELLQLCENSENNIHMSISPLVPYPGTELYNSKQEYIKDFSYSKLDDRNLSVWDEKLGFGVKFLNSFRAPSHTALNIQLSDENILRSEYVKFLALSMTYQFFQGKKKLKEMDIPIQYKENKIVKIIYDSLITQIIYKALP